ncbi:MAG: hypothetical protein ABI898_03885 [Sphingomonadales bacterium]
MADGNTNPFSPRMVAGIVLGGCIAFLGFLLLMAYAPQLKMRTGEGATPMSRSAVGFYGLYELARLTGRPVDLNSERERWWANGFTLVTITTQTDPKLLASLIDTRRRAEKAKTLYIMPKWLTSPLPANRRWVQSAGPLEPDWVKAIAATFGPDVLFGLGKARPGARITAYQPDEMGRVNAPQSGTAAYIARGVEPVLWDSEGRTILGRIQRDADSVDYILADPDLLSNMALKTPEGARNALRIVDALRADSDDSVAFDLALNGSGNSRNLLQLMFEPPFLALTLAVLAAALLAGLHAFNRFGPAVPEPRAIPFGKRALADNTAVLIARAGAARRMGDRYVALIRDGVANVLGASKLQPDDLETWLARLPVAGKDFGILAADARQANSSEHMRAAAASLYQWKEEVTRDRR